MSRERKLSYELIWEDRGVLFRFRDVVTGDELVQSNLDVYANPKFESIEYEVAIFSDSVKFEASSETVRRVAEMDAAASKRNPKVVVAIVASQTVIRGLANLYRLQSEVAGGTWETEFFETEPDARRWLARTSC